MPDLFEVPDSPSPKLLWLKKHRLNIFSNPPDGFIVRNAGWTKVAARPTEDEAVLNYCERHNLKHWTLEQ